MVILYAFPCIKSQTAPAAGEKKLRKSQGILCKSAFANQRDIR